jgi:hypothetical protein
MSTTFDAHDSMFDGQAMHACGALLSPEQQRWQACPQCHRRLKESDVKLISDLVGYAETWLRAFNGKFGVRDAIQALVLVSIQNYREHAALGPLIQILRGYSGRSSESVINLQSIFAQMLELLVKTDIQEADAAPAVPGDSASTPVPVFRLTAPVVLSPALRS